MGRRLFAVVGAGVAALAVTGCGSNSEASSPTTITETVTVQAAKSRGVDAAPAPAADQPATQYVADGIYPVEGDTVDLTYSRIPAGWYTIQTNPDYNRGSWARCRTLACGPNDIIASGTIDGDSNYIGALEIGKHDLAFKMTGLLVAPGVSPIG